MLVVSSYTFFPENDGEMTPPTRLRTKSQFSVFAKPDQPEEGLEKGPEEETISRRMDNGSTHFAKSLFNPRKSEDFSGAMMLAEEIKTEDSFQDDRKDTAGTKLFDQSPIEFSPLTLQTLNSEVTTIDIPEPKHPGLKTRGSSRALTSKKVSEPKEEKKPFLQHLKSDVSETFPSIPEIDAVNSPVAEIKTTPDADKSPNDSGNKKPKAGLFRKGKLLQRSCTTNFDIKGHETTSPDANSRKINEENEKKIREELEISNQQIEILDLIISYADCPRDLGGK